VIAHAVVEEDDLAVGGDQRRGVALADVDEVDLQLAVGLAVSLRRQEQEREDRGRGPGALGSPCTADPRLGGS